MSRNEDTVRRIEDLLVSDRASTMLVCIHGAGEQAYMVKYAAVISGKQWSLREPGI